MSLKLADYMMILRPFILIENWVCYHSKDGSGHMQKNHKKMPGIYQNLDFSFT